MIRIVIGKIIRIGIQGVKPTAMDTVIIPSPLCGGCVMPVLTAAVTIDTLTIQASATVTLAGNAFTITNAAGIANSGKLNNSGTIILRGTETVTIDTIDSDSGTFQYCRY